MKASEKTVQVRAALGPAKGTPGKGATPAPPGKAGRPEEDSESSSEESDSEEEAPAAQTLLQVRPGEGESHSQRPIPGGLLRACSPALHAPQPCSEPCAVSPCGVVSAVSLTLSARLCFLTPTVWAPSSNTVSLAPGKALREDPPGQSHLSSTCPGAFPWERGPSSTPWQGRACSHPGPDQGAGGGLREQQRGVRQRGGGVHNRAPNREPGSGEAGGMPGPALCIACRDPVGLSSSAPRTAALHPLSSPPVLPHIHSPQAPYPDPVLCHSQAKPSGKNSQVRAASATSTGPSAKSAVPTLPRKARAVAAQVAKWDADSESSSEEESDSEGEALRAAALAQVRPLLVSLFVSGSVPEAPPPLLTVPVDPLRLCVSAQSHTLGALP